MQMADHNGYYRNGAMNMRNENGTMRAQSAHFETVSANPRVRPSSTSVLPGDATSCNDMLSSPSSSIATAASEESHAEIDTTGLSEHEAWCARVEKERLAEEKLIEAVCKASLLEYNERERAVSTYEQELSAQLAVRNAEVVRLRARREEAEKNKHDALQRVIDAKKRAASMKDKARDLAKVYEEKAVARVETENEMAMKVQMTEQELALAELKRRKEEALRKREAAEQRAKEATARAEAMRQKAIAAAQVLRQQSRGVIEHQLDEEERQRQCAAELKKRELEENKHQFHARSEAASRRAEMAAQHAEELQYRAQQARRAKQAQTATTGQSSAPVA